MSDIPDYYGAVSTSTEGLVNSIAVDVRAYADKFFAEELITKSPYNTVTDTRINQDDVGRARYIVKNIGLKVKANPKESFCKLLKILKDLGLNDLAESIERKLGELANVNLLTEILLPSPLPLYSTNSFPKEV